MFQTSWAAKDYLCQELLQEELLALRHLPQVLSPNQNVCSDWRLFEDSQSAFLNYCPHKGFPLLEKGIRSSIKNPIVCGLHGRSFRPGCNELIEAKCKKVGPFVIKNCEFPELNSAYEKALSRLEHFLDVELNLNQSYSWNEIWNSNWKLAVENELDEEHIPFRHSDLQGATQSEDAEFGDIYSILSGNLGILPQTSLSMRAYIMSLKNYESQRWEWFYLFPNIFILKAPESIQYYSIHPHSASQCQLEGVVIPRTNSNPQDLLKTLKIHDRIAKKISSEDQKIAEDHMKNISKYPDQLIRLDPKTDQSVIKFKTILSSLIKKNAF